MDLYDTPPPSKYILGLTKWFVMPTEDGKTIPAVAVTQNQGQYWNSGFTLVIMFMLALAGKIVVDYIITYFPLKGNGNRHIMLVAFYNTGDPISATFLMWNYMWKLLWTIRMKVGDPHGNGNKATGDSGSKGPTPDITCVDGSKGPTPDIACVDGTEGPSPARAKIDWGTFFVAFGLFIYMLMSFTAATVAGILIPNNLLMGTVARVNPTAIFYPVLALANNTAREASARLANDAAFRALGTVEYSRDVLMPKVTFNDTQTARPDGNIDMTFGYSYEVTGYDFGLQRAPGLKQIVSGICETHYEWYQANLSDVTMEVYYLWGNASSRRNVSMVNGAPPRALFEVPSTNVQDVDTSGTIRYSILPSVAGRRTRFTNRTDPWYWSVQVPLDTATNTNYAYATGRPAFACNQSLSWQYGPLTVPNTRGLNTLVGIGLKLATFWIQTVFGREFQSTPAIVTLGRNLGFSNLASVNQGFSAFSRVENSNVSLRSDLEDLILGSYVYSREVVRNTALLSPNTAGLQNIALNGSTVPDGTADFVIESKDIQTMSLRVLISVPAITLLLCILVLIRERVVECVLNPARNDSSVSAFVGRSIGFSAVQMYRYLDEEMSGQRRWEGRLSDTPYIKEVDPAENKTDRKLAPEEHIPVSAQYSTRDADGKALPLTSGRRMVATSDDVHDFELQAEYATPKMMLVYEKTESTAPSAPKTDPESMDATEKETGGIREENQSPANSQSTSRSTQVENGIQVNGDLVPCSGQYELAMTRTWRRTVERGGEKKPNWDAAVQTNSKVEKVTE
jgi:hypothetical protein